MTSFVRKKLVIIRQSYRQDGGAEQIIRRVLGGLEQDKSQLIDVSVITQKWDGEAGSYKVINVPKQGVSRTQRLRRFNQSVDDILGREGFDIVQSHERIPGCNIYRAGDGVHRHWLAIREQFSDSIWEKLSWKYSPFHKAVLSAEKALFEHPGLRTVICNSQQIKNDILHYYPKVDPEKLTVIYNGVDTDYFSPVSYDEKLLERERLGYGADDKLLLFVGSGFERKGLKLALQALTKAFSWKLLVVGKDKNQKQYQRQCIQFGVSDRVQFYGVQKEVRSFYSAADMLIHPAYYDPAPNVVLEAMSCGCTVMLSDNCGNAEWITPDHDGFVVKTGDSDAIVNVLEAAKYRDLMEMGKHSRDRVSAYTVEKMIDEMKKIYTRIGDK